MRNNQNEQAFVDNMVSGIRFETLPAKSKKMRLIQKIF